MADTDEITTTESGKRGRPSKAELDAREAELKQREEDLALAERELELRRAEANADMRAADLERAKIEAEQPKPQPAVAARSGSPRSADVRSGDLSQPVRGRAYRGGQMPNEFHIPPEQIPPGISYQWNNYTVFGQNNPSQDSYMAMQGWVPVPTSRHRHLMPVGAKDNDPIVVKGQILVERPIELTREALQEDYQRAIGEVRAKEEQLYGAPQGTMQRARSNGSNEFITVNREVERGVPIKPNYQYENTGGQVIE